MVSGKAARQKGLQFERFIANSLKHVYPAAARQLEFQVDQAQGIDLRGTGPFKIQCKKLKRYASVATINEIKCNDMLGDVPVLITAGDREPAMAVLPWDDLLWLIEHYERTKGLRIAETGQGTPVSSVDK